MPNAQDALLNTIRALIEENELTQAIRLLTELDEQVQAGIGTDVRLQSAKLKEAEGMFQKSLIRLDDYRLTTAQVRNALFSVVDDLPERLALNARVRSLSTGLAIEVPDEATLEKVLGERSHMLQISWLEKALQAARTVCRVVRADGITGTGFITEGGYLFTNHHVLPDAAAAQNAHVEFNYELDTNGKAKNQVAYRLDHTDFNTSVPDELDFARVRIVDRPEQPLSQWGFPAFETATMPGTGDPVTIIQHPNGLDKQIALRANDVISRWKQYLFYTTDTEPGSSGSPVFNADWKVVALHHAGKDASQGGLQINEQGERRPANRGILFKNIFDKLGLATGGNAGAPTAQPQKPEKEFENLDTAKQQAVNPDQEPPKPVAATPKFLVVYDLRDDAAAKMLKKHLNVSILTKKLKAHFVHEAPAGEITLERAKLELADSDFVVALISANLFDSPDWFGLVHEAMENGRRVVPVRIEPVDVEGTGLEKRRSLPSRDRTVADFPSADAAYADVVEGLKQLK